MAAPGLSSAFQVGINILNTVVDKVTGTILALTGDVSSQSSDTDSVEMWGPLGYLARPANPQPGKAAAECITIRRGDRDSAIAYRDQRAQSIAGNLLPGEVCVYAPGADATAQARILLKADGSINLLTRKSNASSGQAFGVFVQPDGSVSIVSPSGAACLLGADGAVKLFNGSGAVQVDSGGKVKISSSGAVNISGSTVTIGGPTALPVAMAIPVSTVVAALQIEIAAVVAAVNAVLAITGPITPAHVTAFQPATAAVTAGAAAVVASAITIPSQRVAVD
jgi:hypothetical protein